MKLVSVAAAQDAADAGPTGQTPAQMYFAFGDALITSAWWDAVSRDYLLARPSGHVHVVGPELSVPDGGTPLSEIDLLKYLQRAIAGAPSATDDGETLYLLYVPQEFTTSTTCGSGWHWTLPSGSPCGVVWACNGATTRAASHEIVEAATDPYPPTGFRLTSALYRPWETSEWGATGGEVGDLCEGTSDYEEGGFTYQRVWSNSAASAGHDPCVPAPSDTYFSASTPAGWYPISAGGTVDIPVIGWSSTALPAWNIDWTTELSGCLGGFFPSLSATTLDNDRSATLTVATSTGAWQADWCTILLQSSSVSGDGGVHVWPVGVYVP